MNDTGNYLSFQYGGERRLDIVVSGSGNPYTSNGGDQMQSGSFQRGIDSPTVNRTNEMVPRSASMLPSKPWGFRDPEVKRRNRIVKYKVYTAEGRMKASIRNGLRWIKNKCSKIIHGY